MRAKCRSRAVGDAAGIRTSLGRKYGRPGLQMGLEIGFSAAVTIRKMAPITTDKPTYED